jgi:hypothetical protein
MIFDGIAMRMTTVLRQREEEKLRYQMHRAGGRTWALRRDFFACEFSLDSFPVALLRCYRI